MGKKLNILLLYGGDFPSSSAYANRMIAFAKGLQKNGHSINFFIIYPGRKLYTGTFFNEEYEGIKCKTTHTMKYPNTFFRKVLYSIFTGYLLLIKIIGSNRSLKIDCIISCSDNIIMTIPIFIWSRINKTILLREYNEYPAHELGISKWPRIIIKFSYKIRFNIFDGMILISSTLVSFFSNFLNKNKKILRIPIIVEPERFCCQDQVTKKDIVFIGDILGMKDGVEILIKAFESIVDKIPVKHNLLLLGDISDKKKLDALKSRVISDKTKEKIIFLGHIQRTEVSSYLNNAYVLVLARPNNKQAKAGFPTKIGEYLSTGNPIICTKVSDIPLYFKNGINSLLVEPENIQEFADKLLFVFNNPEKANKIGKEGRKLVDKEFNYIYQSKRLADFIYEIKENWK